MNVFQRFGVGVKACYLAWFVEGCAQRIAPELRWDGAAGLPAPKIPSAKSPAALPEAAPKTDTPATPAPLKPTPAKPAPPPKPARSDALTLLETLQREARLIDFLKEEISAYQDAQIGAAVRDIHRDAAKVIDRLFAPQPVLDQAEGDTVSISGHPAGEIRTVGQVREGATSGTLVHHGWKASRCELPQWTGTHDTERILAPAEVEIT